MRSVSKLKSRSGFTLVEMVVCMVILAMITMGISTLVIHTLTAWSSGSSKVESDSSVSLAIRKLNADVRIAKSAAATTIVNANDQLTTTVLPLVTDADNETYYDTTSAGTSYNYYVSNGDLYRKIGSGTPTILTRGISDIRFSVTGSMVTITYITGLVTVGSTKNQTQVTVSDAKIYLRNNGS